MTPYNSFNSFEYKKIPFRGNVATKGDFPYAGTVGTLTAGACLFTMICQLAFSR